MGALTPAVNKIHQSAMATAVSPCSPMHDGVLSTFAVNTSSSLVLVLCCAVSKLLVSCSIHYCYYARLLDRAGDGREMAITLVRMVTDNLAGARTSGTLGACEVLGVT